MNLRPFFTALRALGFSKTYESRAGGMRLVLFEKRIGPRIVTVTLWGDANHVASHSVNGYETTLPYPFRDIATMREAIRHESTRMDNPQARFPIRIPHPVKPPPIVGWCDHGFGSCRKPAVARVMVSRSAHESARYANTCEEHRAEMEFIER